MNKATGGLILGICIILLLFAALGTILILIIRALKKYINSEPVRIEKTKTARSLGEVLKSHRQECKMTQEFVAETLGVSRQAVSKWENGSSDPSTSNLVALAKLYGTTAEALLRELRWEKEDTNE